MAAYHNLKMSLRTLKKRLRKLGLTQDSNSNPEVMQKMITILSNEMDGQAANVGYRYSWHRLELQGINVLRERMICKEWFILQRWNIGKIMFWNLEFTVR